MVLELYAWIATYADGTEGLLPGTFETLEGPTTISMLVTHRHDLAVRMEALARRTQYSPSRAGKRIIDISLVTYCRASAQQRLC